MQVDEMQTLLQPTPTAPSISLAKSGPGPFLISMVVSTTACFPAAHLLNHPKP